MSIDRPKSGEVLDQDSIIGMHSEVRSKINDLKEDNLGRSSIGPQHLRTTPELDNLPQNNTSFVMDNNEGTIASTVYINKMITVPSSSSQYGGLHYQNQAGLNTEIGNWLHILTLTPLATKYRPNLEHDYSIIISFDSRVIDFTNSSKVAQAPADKDGMIWYAVEVNIDEKTSSATSNNTRVEEGSVVGCHLIDSNKWIDKTSGAGTQEIDRQGGIEQSVSNTIRVSLPRKVTGGENVYYVINTIKLYAAYTTSDAASKAASSPTNSALIGNTTLRFFILKTPQIT